MNFFLSRRLAQLTSGEGALRVLSWDLLATSTTSFQKYDLPAPYVAAGLTATTAPRLPSVRAAPLEVAETGRRLTIWNGSDGKASAALRLPDEAWRGAAASPWPTEPALAPAPEDGPGAADAATAAAATLAAAAELAGDRPSSADIARAAPAAA